MRVKCSIKRSTRIILRENPRIPPAKVVHDFSRQDRNKESQGHAFVDDAARGTQGADYAVASDALLRQLFDHASPIQRSTKGSSHYGMNHTEALTRINDCRDSHATTLDLSDLGLTELPSYIDQVPWITRLDLSKNELTALPSEISLLVNLEKLHLQENKLGTVPPQIFDLRNLIGLYLSDNQLEILPPEIGQLTKLQELRIGYNGIRALPPEIGKLSALRVLRFGTNRVKDIPTEILALPNISEVSLLGNPLPSFPTHVNPRSNDEIWQFYRTSRGIAP